MYKIVHRHYGQLTIWPDTYTEALDLLDLCRLLNPSEARYYYMRRIDAPRTNKTNPNPNHSTHQNNKAAA